MSNVHSIKNKASPNTNFLANTFLNPVAVVFVLSTLLILLNLLLVHRVRPYTSDDVSWQNILFTWRPFNGHKVILGGSDNFVNKIPFFMLFGHFFQASRKTLLLESAVMTTLGFAFFYISAIYFLKQANIKITYAILLPFVWLASFGHSLSQLFLNPIWRSLEIGLSFFIFMLVAKIFSKQLKPFQTLTSTVTTLLATTTMGILIYSDPFFLYFTIGPIIVFTCILFLLKRINKNQLLSLAGMMMSCLIFAKITSLLVVKSGISINSSALPTTFINFDQLATNIFGTLHAVLFIFGADFFGRPLATLAVISAFINAAIICITFRQVYRVCKKPNTSQHNISLFSHYWIVFLTSLGLLVLVVYTFSTIADGINTYRYLIILVLSMVVLLSFSLGSMPKPQSNLIAVLVILGILCNIGLSLRSKEVIPLPGAIGNDRNLANFDVIHSVRSKGLTKGYANYWQAGIDTYLSQNTVNLLPAHCPKGPAQEFHWLIDDSRFNLPAQNSFYVFDPSITVTENCAQEQIIKQFGVPNDIVRVDGKTILIYDYDITSKMENI